MSDIRGTRLSRLVNDPEVSGDLLLIGVVLAENYDFSGVFNPSVRAMAKSAWPKLSPAIAMFKAKEALKGDIRRYRADDPSERPTCGSPTPRKAACGRNESMFGYVTDWDTGERSLVAACSRHSDWFRIQMDANRGTRPDVVPLPAANSGGELAKHFTEIDWPKLWARLDPNWVRHPEERPWPKPKLSLVLGNGDDDKPAPGRPVLVPTDEPRRRPPSGPPRAAHPLRKTPVRLRYLESVASGSVLASPCEVHAPEGSWVAWYVTNDAGTLTQKWLGHPDVQTLWTPIERTFAGGSHREHVIRLTSEGQKVLKTWRGQP